MKFATTKERIIQYIDFKGVTVTEFFKTTGIKRGFLDSDKLKATVSDVFITKIIAIYNDINIEWLLTGKEPMLKTKYDDNKEHKSYKRNLIPLYNDISTIGGMNEITADIDNVSSTTEYIDAGDWFPGATAAIRHYGDSMVEYPSGSILALKKVEDVRLLVWGRNYCIETTEYRITKRLNKSKIAEHLTGYSSNKETYPDGCLVHEPIDIPTETIRSIYQILGCVTKEYSNGIVEIAGKKN